MLFEHGSFCKIKGEQVSSNKINGKHLIRNLLVVCTLYKTLVSNKNIYVLWINYVRSSVAEITENPLYVYVVSNV